MAQTRNVSVDGLISMRSKHSVDDTVVNIVSALRDKSIKLFAVIDHSGEARALGLKMPPTRLLIFGNPLAGTPLMLAAPSLAIDLPLKLLVAQDTQGAVWVSYNSAEYLAGRHGLAEDSVPALKSLEAVAASATQ